MKSVCIVYQFTSYKLYGISESWYHYIVEKRDIDGSVELYDGLRPILEGEGVQLSAAPNRYALESMSGNRIALWRRQ